MTSPAPATRRIVVEPGPFDGFDVRVIPAPGGASLDREFTSHRLALIHAIAIRREHGWPIADEVVEEPTTGSPSKTQ